MSLPRPRGCGCVRALLTRRFLGDIVPHRLTLGEPLTDAAERAAGLPTPKELGLLDLIRVMPAEGSAQ